MKTKTVYPKTAPQPKNSTEQYECVMLPPEPFPIKVVAYNDRERRVMLGSTYEHFEDSGFVPVMDENAQTQEFHYIPKELVFLDTMENRQHLLVMITKRDALYRLFSKFRAAQDLFPATRS